MKLIKINDINIPEVQIYNERSETHLKRMFEPKAGLFIAETPNVIMRAIDAGFKPYSILAEEKYLNSDVLEKASRASGTDDFPVYTADSEVLSKIAGYKLTRGILCALHRKENGCSDKADPANDPVTDLIGKLPLNNKKTSRIAILEDVMNPTNLGAIFRSAAALDIDAVILTNGCTDPLYRRASRVSMGCVFQIPWTVLGKAYPDTATLLRSLKEKGYVTVAMALKNDSVSISDKKLKNADKLAIILGTEGEGLKDSTIASCDHTAKIPMSHGVDSLNVAAASAVIFWEMTKPE